jgi:methionyl-tRNA formyltransferase
MRIVVHGQQAFGKAVLEALLKRGDDVVAVYVAPEKEGAKADPLKEAALAAKLPVYQPASYRKPEVWEEFKAGSAIRGGLAHILLFERGHGPPLLGDLLTVTSSYLRNLAVPRDF